MRETFSEKGRIMENLVCKNICKNYKNKEVLKNVNLTLRAWKNIWSDRKKWSRQDHVIVNIICSESCIRRRNLFGK